MSDLFAQVKQFLGGFLPAEVPYEITPDTHLKNELGIDSLRMVEVLVEMEKRFDVVFDESDLDPEKLETVDGLVTLIEKKRTA